MDVPYDPAAPPDFKPVDVSGFRKPYYNPMEPYFLEENASVDPYHQFHVWFSNVCEQSNISYEEMNAVCLSTCVNNKPSSRMLLMKKYDKNGFCFFTNSVSRKGRELDQNPNAAMLFYWPFVNRQVRVEGVVEKVSADEVDEYWRSRPANSRIGGMISKQSHSIPSRNYLEDKRADLHAKLAEHGEAVLERPPTWSGYRLKPNYFEFWQGQSDRIHDRIIYREDAKSATGWARDRLAP